MWVLHPIKRVVDILGLYTAFEERFLPNYVFRGESHDFWEMVLVIEGTIGVTADKNSYILEAGSAILHPPLEFHSIRAADGSSPVVRIFSFKAGSMPAFEKFIFSLPKESMALSGEILTLLHNSLVFRRNLAKSRHTENKTDSQAALNKLELLILGLCNHELASTKTDDATGSQNYRHALTVLEENLHRQLNTSELAQLCQMSPSLLKKTFSLYAGMGVMEYFRAKKMNAAVILLREGYSVQETAAKLGYTDASYFSTVFRREMGSSPTHYRDNWQPIL